MAGKKSIKEKLDAELEVAENIILDNHPEDKPIDVKRVIAVRRERGLAPRAAVKSDPVEGDLEKIILTLGIIFIIS